MWKVLKAGSRLLQLVEEIQKPNRINSEGGLRGKGASHPTTERSQHEAVFTSLWLNLFNPAKLLVS